LRFGYEYWKSEYYGIEIDVTWRKNWQMERLVYVPDMKGLHVARIILLYKYSERNGSKIRNYWKSAIEISKVLTLPGKIFGCVNCERLRMKILWV